MYATWKNNGLRFEIDNKPHRDGCISIIVRSDGQTSPKGDAMWINLVSEMWDVIGVGPVQDNTVGQVVETEHLEENGVCRVLVNTYGMGIRKIIKNIKNVSGA